MWEDGLHHHHGEDQHKGGAEHEGCEKKGASGPSHQMGHHGTEVDKYLLKHISRLTEDKDNLSIFVTLCGNSPDLAWLCDRGYDVVGCELSTKAVEQLFQNRVLGAKIDYDEKDTDGGIKTYTAMDGKKLKVYVSDFFASSLSPELTGTFDCVWDCHGIICIPAQLHVQYAEKLTRFLKPGGRMLFSTLDCDDTKGTGPIQMIPVSANHLSELFPSFNIEILENSKSSWQNKKFGGGNWTNPVVLCTSKH